MDKFHTIRDYHIPIFNSPKCSNELDLCVCYCLWGQGHEYLEFLKISLTSQFKYTDIHKASIAIFVSSMPESHLARRNVEKVKKELAEFDVKIIEVEGTFFKYSIINHEYLQNFTNIVLCDCDTYFYGEKHNLYEQLSKNDSILMMKEPDPALKVFYGRMVLSPIKDENEYRKCFSQNLSIPENEFDEWLNSKQWYLSCLMSFKRKHFQGEEWNQYVSQCMSIPTTCDETVFLTYAWKRNIEVKDFEDQNINVILSYEFNDWIQNPQGFSITHPLHGDYCHNPKVSIMYDKILDNIPTIDVATAIYFDKRSPIIQQAFDAFLESIEKHIPQVGYVYVCTESIKNVPVVKFLKEKVKFIELENDPMYIFTAYTKILETSTANLVLCTHVDSFIKDNIDSVVNMINRKNYTLASHIIDVDPQTWPSEEIWCPQLDFSFVLINRKTWFKNECFIRDEDNIKHHPYLEQLLHGNLFHFDRNGTFLLTWYLHMKNCKCYIFAPPRKHYPKFGRFLKLWPYNFRGINFHGWDHACEAAIEFINDYEHLFSKTKFPTADQIKEAISLCKIKH